MVGKNKTNSVLNKDKHFSVSEIMKYVIVAVIVAYVALLLHFSSGSSKTFDEVRKPIEAAIDSENMQDAGTRGLKRFYSLNAADYDGVLFYNSKFNLSAEEVLLIKVKEEEQIHQVVEAIEKKLESRKNDFEGYAPREVKFLDAAQISVRGRFIFLSVGEKADKYKEIFSNSL